MTCDGHLTGLKPFWYNSLFDQDSLVFEEFATLMSLDLGVKLETADDMEKLFESLAELETFRHKKSCVKSGRWFSWANACHDHFPEFWATRMLLKSMHESEQSPDDHSHSGKTFSELRKDDDGHGAGGLRLALRCCSWQMWYSISALKLPGDVLWKWHSAMVKQIKTPQQGLVRNMEMSGDQWRFDSQFEMLAKTLEDKPQMEKILKYHSASFVHLGPSAAQEALQNFSQDLWHYVVGLLGKRGSSQSMYTSPPECYACILHSNEDIAQNALDWMMDDWKNLMLLEQSANKKCTDLASDLGLTVSKPMRLVYQLFSCGRIAGGRQLLKALLKRLPDTKLIEDIHQRLRTTALSNPSNKLGLREVQTLIETSGVFEERKILHPAKLDRTAFKSRWLSTQTEQTKSLFHSGSVQLPKPFAAIMARKTWCTMSEETLARSSCAWEWMRHYITKNLKSDGVSVQEPWAIH